MGEPAADTPIILDLVLKPHRSLSAKGFWVLMALLCGFSFAAGLVFIWVGAWPVIGFLGLDVLLVYWAFRASYASAHMGERLCLTEQALTVSRFHPSGRRESWSLQPYWLKVEIETPPGRASRLHLASHGRSLVIGAFLSPEEREEVAKRLREALERVRQAPCADLLGAHPSPSTSRIE